MEIKLSLVDKLQFKAVNADGNTIMFDSSPDFGGEGKGFRPMEAVMAALAGCSSIDAVHILRKGRSEVTGYTVTVSGKRRQEPLPKVFTDLHLRFEISGTFSEEAMQRAVSLAVEKYCSVVNMLRDKVNITYEAVKVA